MKALRERLAVKPENLRRRLDPATLPFKTTAEVAPVKTTIGQPRAAEAIAFALEVGVRGFHLYVAGSPGTGRESTVLAAVRSFAATRPAPPEIPRAFESEEYARRREQRLAELSTRRAKLNADLHAFAQEREFALQMT